MPKAVVTSVHPPGGGITVGAQHVAYDLVRRGWKVLLLGDPASLVHLVGTLWHEPSRERVRLALGGSRTVGNLSSLTPLTLLPVARDFGAGSQAILDLWPWVGIPSLPRFLTQQGFEDVDLMFLDGPLPAVLRRWVRPRRTVLRIFDDTSDETPWPPALAKRAVELATAADLVVITAPSLDARARALGATRIHLMPNGANLAHFARRMAEPRDLAAIPRPRIVYAGALASWVHFALMDAVARCLPDASFVWIGPGRPPRTVRPANVYYLGSRSYDELPGYLQHCDVGVIPFDRQRHATLVDSVHPLKLYDYLAAGLPVVATPWRELQRIEPPIAFADTPESFAAALISVLRDGGPPARAFVEAAGWPARIDALLGALGLDGSHRPRLSDGN